MNKTELKNFAVSARRYLLEKVALRARIFGVDEKNELIVEEQFGQLAVSGISYPMNMRVMFTSLASQLKNKGYEQLVEEVAYTWFNRIIAIRYMEVNGYLPERVNVLSSNTGKVDPDILSEYDTMDLEIDATKVKSLIGEGKTEEAYRILFIAQCNELNKILPFMFEKIHDYTELLLPDFLLDSESVINKLVINEELTNSFTEVEVIGWLYQYYIAEEKDRVFKAKKKYKKEEIPYATQLFTPNWIVQYMVQNSLGRYWTEAHPEDEDLIEKWDYFLTHEEEDFKEKVAPHINKDLKVEDIKCFDPAMGSGHILVYMFDILYEIYEKSGYMESEIPKLILEKNLYGLDIDDRAYQLACFSVVMKATQYNKRFLRNIQRDGITLNLASIQETNKVTTGVLAYIAGEEKGDNFNMVDAFFNQYKNAKTYGSLINISERDTTFLEKRLQEITDLPIEDLFQADNYARAIQLLPVLLKQTNIMSIEYEIVVVNPPYMGSKRMNADLAKFLGTNYPDSKSDLFAAFMEVNHYLKEKGLYAAINQHSWMFLSSFEKLRTKVISSRLIDTMIHLGTGAFEEISGEVVQSTAFVLRNYHISDVNGIYLRLVDIGKFENKKSSVIESKHTDSQYLYKLNQEEFKKIIGFPISYWASNNIKEIYLHNPLLNDVAEPKQGLSTGNNDKYLRLWFEVDFSKTSIIAKEQNTSKWVPFNKGGGFRKWYGNNEYLINWSNNGQDIKQFKGSVIRNPNYYFKEGITWSLISTSSLGCRYSDPGYIFDAGGSTLFSEGNLDYILGLMASSVSHEILKILNPTLNISNGVIGKIPFIDTDNIKSKEEIINLVQNNIQIARDDWNFFEKSWDFSVNPLIDFKTTTLNNAFEHWEKRSKFMIEEMKTNEEALNKLFANIYELQEDVLTEVDIKEVTLLVNPKYRYKKKIKKEVEKVSAATNEILVEELNHSFLKDTAKELLSFYIGCLVGRFNLDVKGLAYVSGKWDDSKYKLFKPNKYRSIQFTDMEYFEQDIITRLREFLSVAFSPDTVDENMQWLAEAFKMKKGEDSESRLRRYFMDEFFVDHCKMYQKRPIYWLVDSGRQKGLRTLIYMHGYQPDTMATIRFEHLQEIQTKYNNEIAAVDLRIVNPNLSATEKRELEKRKVTIQKRLDELLEFDKELAKYANAQIEIDLDDGVKVNYAKFDKVLAKIR